MQVFLYPTKNKMPTKNNKLERKLLTWINEEGHALKLKTANTFNNQGFRTLQGQYAQNHKTKKLRKIDVLALTHTYKDQALLKINHTIKCQRSVDKPWVIFTDQNASLSPIASVSGSISTKLMHSILCILARDKDIQNLALFKSPQRPGFGGSQAFNIETDLVDSTLKSVIYSAYLQMKYLNKSYKKTKDALQIGVFFRPLIVLEGQLFEAHYNNEKQQITLEEKQQLRLHWKGTKTWSINTLVDIVTIDYLEAYTKILMQESNYLLEKISALYPFLKESIETQNLTPLAEKISFPIEEILDWLPMLKK